MTNKPRSRFEDQIDRYVREDLNAAEARKLAQESLEDADLFEELTSAALVKAALAGPASTATPKPLKSSDKAIPFLQKTRVWAAAAVAAAAVALFWVSPFRVTPEPPEPAPATPRQTAESSGLKPALAAAAAPGQPVLLATNIQRAETRPAEVFRGVEADGRSPQPRGLIVSIEDGQASIDLGSLDGVKKGSTLQVFRDDQSAQPIGEMMVTTVFRERARGRFAEDQEIRVKDQVRIGDGAYLTALLDQADALSDRNDSEAVRSIVERAGRLADTASIPPAERRRAWERLAALEYQGQFLEAAVKYYQSVVDSFNSEPVVSTREKAAAYNNLAVLHLLGNDYRSAEALLNQAISQLPKTDTGYARSANNLGVLAELRGDMLSAQSLYDDAASAIARNPNSSEQDGRAIETNQARLRNSH